MCFDGGKPRAMGRRMDICTVIDFNRFLDIRYHPPEFLLDLILGNDTTDSRFRRKILFNVFLAERVCLFSEFGKRIFVPVFKAKLVCADETLCAEPVVLGDRFQRRVETEGVVTSITAVAEEQT